MAVEQAAVALLLQVRCPQNLSAMAVGIGVPKPAAVFAKPAGEVPTAPNLNAPTTAKTKGDAWMENVNALMDLAVTTVASNFAFWIAEIMVIVLMAHVFARTDSLAKTAPRLTALTTAWVAANV